MIDSTATSASDRQPKFWGKHRPEGNWDAIVIGSGMGGMTAAASLAKFGYKVLVLEQHYVPGGFTHTFRRREYVWDVGVHAIGEVTRHSMVGRVLETLTDGELKWASLGENYDEFHFPGGFFIQFPNSPAKFRENLVAAFPDEERAIDDYLRLVKEVVSGMRGYYLSRVAPKWASTIADLTVARKAKKFFEETTSAALDKVTTNPKLKAVMVAQWGYYGSPPSTSSLAIHALVLKHFMHGGFYPVGGSGEIARTLLQTVHKAGGFTQIHADVEQIVLERGRAVGVRMKDGSIVRAPVVVSAAGVVSTLTNLLPPDAQSAQWVQRTSKLTSAAAHLCLYLGFKGDIREAGASASNQWFYDTWDTERTTWKVHAGQPVGRAPCLYCSFPSLKDPLHDAGADQTHTGEIVTFVPWESFEKWQGSRWHKRGEEYEAFKEEIKTQMLRQFFESRPELEKYLAYAELSTPVTTDHFVRPTRGSIYGLEAVPDRFRNPWLRPKTPIPGLYLAGSDVGSMGVIGAFLGGLLCAGAIEPRKLGGLIGGR